MANERAHSMVRPASSHVLQDAQGGAWHSGTDWSSEIGPDPTAGGARDGDWLWAPGPGVEEDAPVPGTMSPMDSIGPDIENRLPDDMVEAPTSMEEVYRGSLKALLLRNVGNYVVATFLIGTQTTVSWEGILYDVGNDYLAIYQSGRDQYIVSDLYSLKYVEFYDTRRRQLCDDLIGRYGDPSSAAGVAHA